MGKWTDSSKGKMRWGAWCKKSKVLSQLTLQEIWKAINNLLGYPCQTIHPLGITPRCRKRSCTKRILHQSRQSDHPVSILLLTSHWRQKHSLPGRSEGGDKAFPKISFGFRWTSTTLGQLSEEWAEFQGSSTGNWNWNNQMNNIYILLKTYRDERRITHSQGLKI